jgi:L-lactate utilization protein LutC
MSAREAFLKRVRTALGAEQRPGTVLELEARGQVGYQGGGADPVARFIEQFQLAGGKPQRVQDKTRAQEKVIELVGQLGARNILLGRDPVLEGLGLFSSLKALGLEIRQAEAAGGQDDRDGFFAADMGITGVNCLIAETGSMVLESSPAKPRSLSLLPPMHLAVAEARQIIPDLFDYFTLRSKSPQEAMPSCVTVVTGPSKTGDIELRLVTGVHGPGELHLVLIA